MREVAPGSPSGWTVNGRRLEAVRRLGWRTVWVCVRAGISDELTRLVAEQDENATHKPLAPIEAARLFREMRKLMREDAARRQQATRFGTPMPAGVGAVPVNHRNQSAGTRWSRGSRRRSS